MSKHRQMKKRARRALGERGLETTMDEAEEEGPLGGGRRRGDLFDASLPSTSRRDTARGEDAARPTTLGNQQKPAPLLEVWDDLEGDEKWVKVPGRGSRELRWCVCHLAHKVPGWCFCDLPLSTRLAWEDERRDRGLSPRTPAVVQDAGFGEAFPFGEARSSAGAGREAPRAREGRPRQPPSRRPKAKPNPARAPPGVRLGSRGDVGRSRPRAKRSLEEDLLAASERSESLEILKQFDFASKYGPCLGITRSQRWARASALGLDPPPAVIETLARARARQAVSAGLDRSVFECAALA